MIWVIDCNDGASLGNFDEGVAGKLVSVEPVKPLNMSHGHPRYCHYKPQALWEPYSGPGCIETGMR
jgi:hypothetical protein